MEAHRFRAAMLVALLCTVAAPGVAPARSKPDLRVAAVSKAPERLAEGAAFRVEDTVANQGRRRAGRSDVRYYLTTDVRGSLAERRASRLRPRIALGDVLLDGARKVPALRPDGTARARGRGVRVKVPAGTPAGDYRLLACADDRDAVAEADEADNCRAAGREIAVSAIPGRTLRTDAFSDTRPTLDPEDEQTAIDRFKAINCTPTAGRQPPFERALRGLRAHLTATAGADAMQAFRRSPEHRSVVRLEAAAGAAVATGSPGAALAALLRAHDLQPKDATHLVNAAGVATAVGRPHEALALLDRALRLDAGDPGPMGISRQAVALTARGQALVDVGRYAEAERVLAAAQGLEPLLREAATGLAAAQVCQGKPAAAAYRRARKRTEKRDPVPPSDREGPSPLDESQGRESDLRVLPLPATADQAPAYREWVERFQHEDEPAAQVARITRGTELRQALATDDALPVERRRRDEVLHWARIAPGRPDTVELDRRHDAEILAAQDARHVLFGSGDVPGRYSEFQDVASAACAGADDYERCYVDRMRAQCVPVAAQLHREIVGHLAAAYDLARERHRLLSRRASGIAANVASPAAYELVMLEIEEWDAIALAGIAQQARYWTMALDQAHSRQTDTYHCLGAPLAPETPDPGAPRSAGSGPCNGAVKNVNLLWPLGPVTLKASCESVSIEGSTPGWIAGFAEVKYNYRAGQLTVLAGAKGEVGLGPVKGDFKSGVYVTAGQAGIEDMGWRVGPSVTVGAGPVEFNPDDAYDLSVMPSREPPG